MKVAPGKPGGGCPRRSEEHPPPHVLVGQPPLRNRDAFLPFIAAATFITPWWKRETASSAQHPQASPPEPGQPAASDGTDPMPLSSAATPTTPTGPVRSHLSRLAADRDHPVHGNPRHQRRRNPRPLGDAQGRQRPLLPQRTHLTSGRLQQRHPDRRRPAARHGCARSIEPIPTRSIGATDTNCRRSSTIDTHKPAPPAIESKMPPRPRVLDSKVSCPCEKRKTVSQVTAPLPASVSAPAHAPPPPCMPGHCQAGGTETSRSASTPPVTRAPRARVT